MNKDYKKHEIVNFIKGFAIGYFLVEIVCWFFKALAGKKIKNEKYKWEFKYKSQGKYALPVNIGVVW